MIKYSFGKLPQTDYIKVDEDIRFDIPKGRIKYIGRALYDNLFVFPKSNIFYLSVIVITTISGLIRHDFDAIFIVLSVILILKAALAFLINRQYSSLKASGIFPVITPYGVRQVATCLDKSQYITVTEVKWTDIDTVRFYSDFISIQIKDQTGIKDGGRSIYIMTDNAEKSAPEIAYLWAGALKGKDVSVSYSEKEEKEVSDYIRNRFGDFETVLHEIVSSEVHHDVAIIPPSEGRDYITLCTIGAGACPMNIDDEIRFNHELIDRAEYLIFLPADWKYDSESLKDNKYYWPFSMILNIAVLPIKTGEWLGNRHTAGPEDKDLLSDSVAYCCSLLTHPAPEFDTAQYVSLSSGKTIGFYQIHPLTAEEIDSCLNNTEDFLEQMYPEGCNVIETYLSRLKNPAE